MPWNISVSLYFSFLRGCFLKEFLSQLFLQLLIVLGRSLPVSHFWLLLGFLPVPFSSTPLEKRKKKIFPLHLDSLFLWQETKGRHCLWKSNRFQICEHKVRLRESDALQNWRCCAWCRDGEIVDVWGIPALLLGWRSSNERQDSCRGEQNSFPVCLYSLAFSDNKQVPVGWIAVDIAQETVGWWKDSREPASAYGQ